MQNRIFLVAALPLFALVVVPSITAQTEAVAKAAGTTEIYGGYSLLSNSFNSHSYASGTNFRGPVLNGWAAAVNFPSRGRLGIKVEGLGFYGTSLGDPTHANFFLAGGQYSKGFGRESAYVHLLAGLGHINDQALTLGGEGPSSNISVAADGGGGIDTPLSRHIAWRVEGALLFAHFTAASNQIQGSPNYFGRFSTGMVLRF